MQSLLDSIRRDIDRAIREKNLAEVEYAFAQRRYDRAITNLEILLNAEINLEMEMSK